MSHDLNTTIVPDLTDILLRLRELHAPGQWMEIQTFYRHVVDVLKECQNIPYIQDRSLSALRLVLEIRDFAYELERDIHLAEHECDDLSRSITRLLCMAKTLLLY